MIGGWDSARAIAHMHGEGRSGQSERFTHIRHQNGINAASFTREIFD